MINPFETIDARLSNIENLLLDIKHAPQTQPLNEPDELWTVKQACAGLDASRPTLNTWIKKGYLHPRRLGRRVYFSKNEILNRKGC